MTIVHIIPRNDLIEHQNVKDNCLCGPSTEPVTRKDGSVSWLVIHNSLREATK